MFKWIFIPLLAFSALHAEEKSTLEQKVKDYVAAYNKHDAPTVASFWAEDSDYISPITGQELKGRKAIEDSFQKLFQHLGDVKLDVKINEVKFPNENEAVVDGVFYLKRDGKDLQSAFKTYFEKQNGQWLIVDVRDIDITQSADHYQHLKGLEWLIGNWVDADEDVSIDSSFQWDSSKNFIYQKFSVKTEGQLDIEGTQIIGWDPIRKAVRSWVFDTDGTFGESTWTSKEGSWVVETAQTLADGSKASSINTFTPVDANSYKWSSTGREVGGQMLPNIEPITIQRKG